MSVGTADIMKAIVTAWNASTLNATFQALWASSVTASQWAVLYNGDAPAGQPFPYCVMDSPVSPIGERMTNTTDASREVRNAIITFNIHARTVSGDSRTADEIAAYLAEEVLKVLGDHVSTAASLLTLDNGNHLWTRKTNDFGVWTGDDEYQWVMELTFLVDVPVVA